MSDTIAKFNGTANPYTPDTLPSLDTLVGEVQAATKTMRRGERIERRNALQGVVSRLRATIADLFAEKAQRERVEATAKANGPIVNVHGAELTAGAFVMHHGGVVMLSHRYDQVAPPTWGVEYVQITPSGEIMCGGSSSAWPSHEFRPITDPRLACAANVYRLRRDIKAHEHAITTDRQALAAQLAAFTILSDIGRLSSDLTHAAGAPVSERGGGT